MEQFDIWAFLGWLAMFVFGMDVLEDCIHSLWYAKLKKFLSKTVNTNMRAIFAGTVLAGVLQSGTIVSLMVLAFAGAGIMTLAAAIGVIVWANVWGTFLSVIIAKIGFGYSISAFALPLIATWGILLFFKHKTIKLIGQLILSFWLLLFGIWYLKDSVSVLAQSIDVAKYANTGWYVFYFGGALLALLLHSSGTATIIGMTALSAGIISFDQAVITMLGASIGSSLVSMYVSIGWSAIKRNVALTHFGFNTLWAIIFLFFVPWTEEFMQLFMDTSGSKWPAAIARYQVIYNILTGLMIYPLINKLAHVMEQYSSKDTSTDYQLLSINDHQQYDDYLEKDILTLLKKIYKFNVHHLDLDQKIILNTEYTTAEKYYAIYHLQQEDLDEDYDILKTIEEAILRWLLRRIHHESEENDKKYLHYYEIIESLMYSAKSLHDVRDNFITLTQSESLMIKERVQHLREQMVDLYLIVACIITEHNIKQYDSSIKEQLNHIGSTNKQSADLLGQHLHRQSMPGGELSALLHLTNWLNRSHRSLVDWLEKFFQ